mgnify:CR=1 FL=1
MQSLNFSELIIEKARKQGKKAILIIGEEPVIKKHINNVIQKFSIQNHLEQIQIDIESKTKPHSIVWLVIVHSGLCVFYSFQLVFYQGIVLDHAASNPIHLHMFYVLGRLSGGRMSNGLVAPGGSVEELSLIHI